MASRRTTRRATARNLSGVFDVHAAWALEELIERAAPAGTLCLDFTRVSEYHDLGIAVLAQALKSRRSPRVALCGLGAHQLRLLRAFGVDSRRHGITVVHAGA